MSYLNGQERKRMLNEAVKNKLDAVIEDYKGNPEKSDNNIWRCYEACKATIRELERSENVKWSDYIIYVTDKLGI